MEGKRPGSGVSHKDPKKRKQYISGRGRGQVTQQKAYKIDTAQIHSGLRGIFVSTNHMKEDLAARETLAMLLEVAPEVYPDLFDQSGSASDADADGEPSVLDVEAELKKERDSLKQRRDHFTLVTLPHAKNKAFVRILDDTIDPSLLLDKFFESVVENGSTPTKHCQRFTPVLRTCLASNQEQWVKAFAEALAPHFKVDPDHPPKSYGIIFNSSFNNEIHRSQVNAAVGDIVLSFSINHKVDLDSPDVFILVDTYKSAISVGISRNYKKFAKYNPLNMVHRVAEQRSSGISVPAARAPVQSSSAVVAAAIQPVAESEP